MTRRRLLRGAAGLAMWSSLGLLSACGRRGALERPAKAPVAKKLEDKKKKNPGG